MSTESPTTKLMQNAVLEQSTTASALHPVNSGQYPVPLVVGVVGHRDLVDDEIPRLQELVRDFLAALREQFPNLALRVITPLAEGADRLVAHEAINLGISLIIPMPMPVDLYLTDFQTEDSLQEFHELCQQGEVIDLPLLSDSTEKEVAAGGMARDRQYAQLGVFICAHAHILLALWDGKESAKMGGTAQVIKFHHYDTMDGHTSAEQTSRLLLADDESDLVYHIVCSRTRPDGEPISPLQPFDTAWLTTEPETPRTQAMPERYLRIFRRTSEFNLDFARHADPINRERWDLLTWDADPVIATALGQIDEIFVIADWLAGYFQKRFNFMLKATHTMAVLMGLAFIAYSDISDESAMIYLFLGLFAVAGVMYLVAERRAWHRKYLDYRALAEGLRVQFFWAAGGVTGGEATKFTHDNFLQKQDVELGWIRNVMRVAGLYSDVECWRDPTGLQLAITEWIGSNDSGQTGYYKHKADERTKVRRLTQVIGTACLWTGIIAALVIAIFSNQLTESAKSLLIVLMGLLPLIAATRDAYAHKKAEKELIKQYRFMHRVFQNALLMLNRADTEEERRQILKAVGDACLDEHAEWILMHRERPLEMGGL